MDIFSPISVVLSVFIINIRLICFLSQNREDIVRATYKEGLLWKLKSRERISAHDRWPVLAMKWGRTLDVSAWCLRKPQPAASCRDGIDGNAWQQVWWCRLRQIAVFLRTVMIPTRLRPYLWNTSVKRTRSTSLYLCDGRYNDYSGVTLE